MGAERGRVSRRRKTTEATITTTKTVIGSTTITTTTTTNYTTTTTTTTSTTTTTTRFPPLAQVLESFVRKLVAILFRLSKKVSAWCWCSCVSFFPVGQFSLPFRVCTSSFPDKRFPWLLVPLSAAREFVPELASPPCRLPRGLLYQVAIRQWSLTNLFPGGVVVGVIGSADDIDVQTKALIHQADLARHLLPFGDDVLQQAKDIVELTNNKLESEVEKRKDLRGLRVFTIDPATARDLDDAINVRRLPLSDGRGGEAEASEASAGGGEGQAVYEVGVHIADVSHYVPADSPVDLEARQRATTVYMTHCCFPMLPRELCDGLCSLSPGEDKLTFSVVFRLNEEGELLQTFQPQFFKSVIRTCCRWNYDQVQTVLDGDASSSSPPPSSNSSASSSSSDSSSSSASSPPEVCGGHLLSDLVADIRLLGDLTTRIRTRRFENGSLSLDQTKMRFFFDDEDEDRSRPIGYGHESRSPSHYLIEELMLMSNTLVARRLVASPLCGAALLRRHPAPLSRYMKDLEEFVRLTLGFRPDLSSAGKVHAALQTLRLEFSPAVSAAVEMLLFKPMRPAAYFVFGKEPDPMHYALNFELYTHFTSPIRRYADLIVHRVLELNLEFEEFYEKEKEEKLRTGGVPLALEVAAPTGGDGDGGEDEVEEAREDGGDSEEAEKGKTFMSKLPASLQTSSLDSICSNCNDKKSASKSAQTTCDLVFMSLHIRQSQKPLDASAIALVVGGGFLLVHIPLIGVQRARE
eukprot:GHVT01081160.1.p1 GENE.GHVT01081160.1~~GHVT01081160.1.p1  ORF type:complete len:748 (-),score=182.23 GHVT01081160.1:967-3210(-)